MSDLISTQESVAKIVDTAIRKILSGEQKLTKEYEQSVIEAVNVILDTARRECGEAEAQAEIVRCKDCENWIPGYITDNDDFIPPKCGKYQQMVGHSSDDYCSHAERRTDGRD